MSRRDKKKIGNPNPPRSGNWLENREKETTPARVLARTEINQKAFTLYPVGRLRKIYRGRA